MAFDLTQDQRDFAEMLRSVFAKQFGPDQLRAVVDHGKGYDRLLWKTMVIDLELPGLTTPEALGGSAAGAVELSLLLEQYGRSLVSSPLLATLGLAVPAIYSAGTEEARATWLPRIATGAVTGSWALLDSTGEADLAGSGVEAVCREQGWTLSGQRSWVLDGATADVLLTVARTPDGPALFLVEATAASGLVRSSTDNLDPTLPVAELVFELTPAHRLSGDGAIDGLVRALALANIGITALQLGCLAATLDLAVEYAATRTQFGRPIGGFQAIKHRCADVFMDTETTRWVVHHAAALASDPEVTTDDLAQEAHLASAYAATSSFRAVANLLQILGGIGYTWEHDGHLYFKRATAAARLLGSTRSHLDAVSRAIDAAPSPAPSL